MTADLSQIDPVWAWSAYEPNAERPWNKARAAHLFRRAGFGATPAELEAAVKASPAEVVRRLCAGPEDTAAFDRTLLEMSRTVLAGGNPENLSAWWLYRMLYTPDQMLEKMTLFWHGHFATSAAKVKDARQMLAQNDLLRRDARGDFVRLVQGISRDPAMLHYLDSTTNRKTHPNENYARELLELFCLGPGRYTENDIQQIARCFTGWELRHGEFQFNEYQHDPGSKTVFGKTGKFSGEDAVKMVCEQPAAPRFIVAKLIRYFLFDEPQPPDALVEPLANQLRENGFQLGPVLERLLGSRLFFSEFAQGKKIRSPIETAVGLLRSLEGSANLYRLSGELAQLGQTPFFPPNVKGWDGGRTWINSSTLIGRANLVGRLVRDRQNHFAGGNLADWADARPWKTPEETVDGLLELLVAVPVPAEVRRSLLTVAGEGDDRHERLAALIHTLGALPEFQLC